MFAVLLSVPLLLGAIATRSRNLSIWSPQITWPAGAIVLASMNLAPGVVPANFPVAAMLSATLAVAASLLCLSQRAWPVRIAVVTAVASDLALAGVRMHWGTAQIDVFGVIQGSTAQLLHGHNPYTAVYPSTTPGVPYFHFEYAPALLLLSAPFRLLGDIRVANAAAMVALFAGVGLVARERGGAVQARRYLALAVAMPFVPFMIAQAWPEVYPVAGVALWLALRQQHPRWAVASLAMGLCTVPTATPLLALPWLWWRPSRREITVAALLAIALCVPFVAWAGVVNFVSDTVGVQLQAPVRIDALSLNALLWHLGKPFLPGWLGIAASGVTLAAMAVWGRRDWATALLLGATLTLIVFLTAKWAFFNYYFIVAYGLLLSLALAGPATNANTAEEMGSPFQHEVAGVAE